MGDVTELLLFRSAVIKMKKELKAKEKEIEVLRDALIGISEEPWSMSDDPALRSGHIAFQAIKLADKIRSESE